MEELTDHQLIARYLKGDEKSLEVLISRYTNLIYSFVFKYVNSKEMAEDITQETFLKVWRNIKKIDKEKNFKSWIYTIAKNTALDAIKKKKAVPFSQFEYQDGKNALTEKLVDPNLLPIKLSQSRESQTYFLAAIKNLSEKYRLVLSYYYYQGLNFREIAETLKESINTIKSRHRRGLQMLKKSMDDTLIST